MKLLTKISFYFFSISIIVFIVASIAAYFVLNNILLEDIEEKLLAEKESIIQEMRSNAFKDSNNINFSFKIEINRLSTLKEIDDTFSDTLIIDFNENEEILYRQLKFSTEVNGQNYLITLARPSFEQEDLVEALILMVMVFFISIITILNLINIWGGRKWWAPFYTTITKLSGFSINQKEPLYFPPDGIDEFDKLNKALNSLTAKLMADYISLKEFSDNASHEMQTPLAIIRSKLDVLIQNDNVTEDQFNTIRSIYDAVNRLTKLNSSLNLLAKIENLELADEEKINIGNLIEKQLDNTVELLSLSSIKVHKNLLDNVILKANPFLAETMFSNLLINAINHNIESGNISIELNREFFQISNTGNDLNIEPDLLFERFRKGSYSPESTGLGLAIVKKICERYNYKITYTFKEGVHTIIVQF